MNPMKDAEVRLSTLPLARAAADLSNTGKAPTPISLVHEQNEMHRNLEYLFEQIHIMEDVMKPIAHPANTSEPAPPACDNTLPDVVEVARQVNHRIRVATEMLSQLRNRLAI